MDSSSMWKMKMQGEMRNKVNVKQYERCLFCAGRCESARCPWLWKSVCVSLGKNSYLGDHSCPVGSVFKVAHWPGWNITFDYRSFRANQINSNQKMKFFIIFALAVASVNCVPGAIVNTGSSAVSRSEDVSWSCLLVCPLRCNITSRSIIAGFG